MYCICSSNMRATYGMSLGVAGSAGGGGRLINVGALDVIVNSLCIWCSGVFVKRVGAVVKLVWLQCSSRCKVGSWIRLGQMTSLRGRSYTREPCKLDPTVVPIVRGGFENAQFNPRRSFS